MTYKTLTVNGKQIRLHRYVMQCFLGRELLSSEIVHHKDGNKFNNNIENLEILTRSEHLKKHYKEIGSIAHRFQKKYEINIDILREQYQNPNITFNDLAKEYGCSTGTISNLLGKGARMQVLCNICGDKAQYIKKRLCMKCYLKEYHARNK